MDKSKILIIEDDEGIRTQMKWALTKEYEVLVAVNRHEAMSIFRKETPGVVMLDLGLPPDPDGTQEGFQILGEMIVADPLAKIIVITGQEGKEYALKGIEQGAYDYFCKPVEVDDLKVVLRRALHVYQLEVENRLLKNMPRKATLEGMMGTSPEMQEVFSRIRKVASSDISVLILGESGTGKELAAKAIHRLSKRKESPFVTINCGAIPENLLESELFGHEKGAFTGAYARKKGRIESADNGTLFLDEIGELPMSLQVKLLRFLQDQRLLRIGGKDEFAVDVRIVAATNSDLKTAMKAGRFREDLYFRLAVFMLNLPPLRERQGDIPLLANAFLLLQTTNGKKKVGFSVGALKAMELYSWPGNVRELENKIKRALILAEGSKLTPKDLDIDSPLSRYSSMGLKEAREATERELIQNALTRYKGNISKAAAELGISRPTLYELMDKLSVQRP